MASAEQPSTAPGKKYGFIEGIRGVAALYVVFQHMCTMIDPEFRFLRRGAQPAWLAEVFRFFLNGHFAVAAFIVVSGFCLQMSLHARNQGQLRDLKQFLYRRCRRILPPYYACLALSLVVCFTVTQHQQGLPWAQYLPVTAENVLAHVFMVHNLRPDWMYKINGVLWSISIEFQLYFLFPLFNLLLLRAKGLLTGVLLTLPIYFILVQNPAVTKLYLWYASLFVWGMVAAWWAFRPNPRPVHFRIGQVALVLGLALALWSTTVTKNLVIRDSLIGIAVCGLLYLGVNGKCNLLALPLGSRLAVGLGAFSYSLYLMHHPILQVLYVYRPAFVEGPADKLAYFWVVGLPVVLALCYGFYLLFEKPFIRTRQVKV